MPTDQKILDLAARRIRDFGPARLTVVGLAEELGMSHANVYRYFPSKSALLDAVTAGWLAPIETALRSVAESPDPARDKLERALASLHRAYRDRLDADPRAYELFVAACRARTSLARRHRGRVLTELRRILEEGLAAAAFAEADSARLLTLVMDATFRFTDPVGLAEDRDAPRRQVSDRLERALDVLLAGLKAKVSERDRYR